MSQVDQMIQLREELIVKMTDLVKVRKERIESAEGRINELRAAREQMIVDMHGMEKEIDEMRTRIANLKLQKNITD